MPYVQVKQKYQVTIPAAVRKNMNLKEGDMLEVREQDGLLVLIPQALMERRAAKPANPLTAMIGANKGSGLYKSAQEIDEYIRNLRNEWN